MDTLAKDLKYVVRMLRRTPGAAAVSVLALGLGIGANISCFITVNALVLHPLAYPEQGRIATLWETVAKARSSRDLVAPANFLDWKERNGAFQQLAAYRSWDVTMTGSGDPERVQGCLASAELFPLLGLKPIKGRVFTAAEMEPGRDDVAVISQGFWRTRMAAAPDVVGRTITLAGRVYRVLGVMPEDFDLPLATDVWAPLTLTGEEKNQRAARDLMVLGRLKPGVSMDQARAAMNGIARQLSSQYPRTNEDRGIQVVPLRQLTNDITDRFVLTLLGAAGFVLLLACANVGNLQLSRALARQKMFAVQTALGATRLRIARVLALESLVLSLAGGVVGLWLASWNLERNANIPAEVVRWVAGIRNMRVDGNVVWFTIGASLAAGLLCSAPAACHLLRIRAGRGLAEVLKEGGRGSGMGSARTGLRSALMVFEVAMALLLLVGAGLMVRTFHRLVELSPGYDVKNLLTMQVSLPAADYRSDARVTEFYDLAVAGLAAVPNVRAAGANGYMPAAEGVFREGNPEPRPGEPIPEVHAVSAHYLEALGLPLVSGRFLSERDRVDARPVVVLSEEVVKHYWPGPNGAADAVGRRIRLNAGAPWLTVVGVVGDIKDWFTQRPNATAYVPYPQAPRRAMQFALRTSVDPMLVVPGARAAIANVDRNLAVFEVKSMETMIREQSSGVGASADTMAMFAAIALLLAVTGIYAVVAYAVVQRTHEIGIRMALGASRKEVIRMTLVYAFRMAGMGLAIGAPAAFIMMHLLSRLLYGVVVVDSMTIVGFAAILAAAALAAGYIPARQASRVDPLAALRVE